MSSYRLKGASGPVMNRSFPLAARTVIGRADDCDLRVDGEGVSGRHAEIVATDEGLTLRLLDPSGELLLNGQPVESATLASGDEIRIGRCRFVLQAPGLKPARVLTAEATRPRRGWLPWLIVGTLLAASAVAWHLGLLPF